MSRTFRKASKSHAKSTKKFIDSSVRDGSWTRHSKSCENNGVCDYCENNRKFSTEKRKPIEEV